MAQCRELRRTILPHGLPVGQVIATGAGQLPCRWVIHTVGPDAHRGQTDPALLESCFRESLKMARDLDATSVAFPAISAGVYGWSAPAVAAAAARVMKKARHEPGSVELVRFILFSKPIVEAFRAAFETDAASG
jgi:O-acetyl-ADP-ribose deacetylase (regulator of RNase III)